MLNTTLFLLQLAVIIGFSQVVAWVFRRAGQPRVVGEMAAGVALGPTLFGALAPGLYQRLFPAPSLNALGAVSEAGLVIFLFLVGVRVDFAELRDQSRVAVMTGITGILTPCLGGIALGYYLGPRYGAPHLRVFALFIGTAMSVTAFPVLARIVSEHNLLGTSLGSVAIACAALSDLAAWILLAMVAAVSGGGARSVRSILLLAALFIVVLIAVRAALRVWFARRREASLGLVVGFMIFALAAAAASGWIGIHPFVGAFAAGLTIPRQFRNQLIDRLETVTLVLPMPIFFALTGIRTNLLPAHGRIVWPHLALILAVAIATKWGGSLAGARLAGMPWRDANRLGALMNTRGLVELVVLNVGRDSGILPPTIFSMMVCMALLTTLMATPFLRMAGRGDMLADRVRAL